MSTSQAHKLQNGLLFRRGSAAFACLLSLVGIALAAAGGGTAAAAAAVAAGADRRPASSSSNLRKAAVKGREGGARDVAGSVRTRSLKRKKQAGPQAARCVDIHQVSDLLEGDSRRRMAASCGVQPDETFQNCVPIVKATTDLVIFGKEVRKWDICAAFRKCGDLFTIHCPHWGADADGEKRIARIDNFVVMGWYPVNSRLNENTLRSFLANTFISATQDFCAPEMNDRRCSSFQQIQAVCVSETGAVPALSGSNYSVRDSTCDPDLFDRTRCDCVEKSNLFG